MCGIYVLYMQRIVTFMFVNNVFAPQCGGYVTVYMQLMVSCGHSVAFMHHVAVHNVPNYCANRVIITTVWREKHRFCVIKKALLPPLSPPLLL